MDILPGISGIFSGGGRSRRSREPGLVYPPVPDSLFLGSGNK